MSASTSSSGSGSGRSVTILGAGVTALTSACVLRGAGYAVHVYARDLPWDSDSVRFASPWAGANWCSFASTPDEQRWDAGTYAEWSRLVDHLPASTMARMRFSHAFATPTKLWFKDLVGNFQEVSDGKAYTVEYDSFTISVPAYTAWLVRELTVATPSLLTATSRALGPPVTFTRVGTVPSLAAAASQRRSDVLINATGLGSSSLSDVSDAGVHAIRGQTLLVLAPLFTDASVARCVMRPLDNGEPLYVIPRARSGHVILGGTYGVNDTNTNPSVQDTRRILEGCARICPQLLWTDPTGTAPHRSLDDLQKAVLRVNVGLRPARKGGARVELGNPVNDADGRPTPVVHAYGIGPAGYQASFGIANQVKDLVDAAVPAQAKL